MIYVVYIITFPHTLGSVVFTPTSYTIPAIFSPWFKARGTTLQSFGVGARHYNFDDELVGGGF